MLPSFNWVSAATHVALTVLCFFAQQTPVVPLERVDCHCHCNVTETASGVEVAAYGFASLALVVVAVVTWTLRTVCCCLREATNRTLVQSRRGRIE